FSRMRTAALVAPAVGVNGNSPVGVDAPILGLAVSPNYPSDNFVIAAFNGGTFAGQTFTPGAAGANTNGVCWSTDGGLTFGGCHTGLAAEDPGLAACAAGTVAAGSGNWDRVQWRTVSLSPDFNFSTNTGQVAIGGTGVGAALQGNVAFRDTYSSVGSSVYYAAANDGATGGVFRFNGTAWENKTTANITTSCNLLPVSMTAAGTGSATKLVVSFFSGAG